MFTPVVLKEGVIKNHWMHYVCVSNSKENWLKAYLFNHWTDENYKAENLNSRMVNMPESVPLRTMIGNSL